MTSCAESTAKRFYETKQTSAKQESKAHQTKELGCSRSQDSPDSRNARTAGNLSKYEGNPGRPEHEAEQSRQCEFCRCHQNIYLYVRSSHPFG